MAFNCFLAPRAWGRKGGRLSRLLSGIALALVCSEAAHGNTALATPGGLVFHCPGAPLQTLANALTGYLGSMGVAAQDYVRTVDEAAETVQFQLADQTQGSNTLNLVTRQEFDLKESQVQLPTRGQRLRSVSTVSQKEIVLALLQNGRTTRFEKNACTLEALKDQVGVRQNTVAWAESLAWRWPNGNTARWNTTYWRQGNLQPRQPLHRAVMDVFLQPQKYSIGCYTATKLVIIQGILDYYRRIKKDAVTTAAIEKRLLQDGDPLSYIEPGTAWYFEKESSPEDRKRSGKLVFLSQHIPSDNFIPGDWSYFLNTDPVTYEKTGYEGSNAIYLGRGKFDDYYNDNNHSYTYKEKLQEVYQWRHHVFSRVRDVAKMQPLTPAEIDQLGEPPERGGPQLAYRMIPYAFGFSELPQLPASVKVP